MLRLLFRLFLQRVDQRQREQRSPDATSTLAMHRQHASGQGDKQRAFKRWFAFVIVLACLSALGWQLSKLSSTKITTNVDHAELRLHILSSNSWPLVVYLQGADLPLPSSTPAETSKIESINGAFAPKFQVVPIGGALEIINNDAIAHNTHVFNRGDTIFNVALPLPGITVTKPLTGSGVFSVRCDLHPWMEAWLFVPPSRYYAVLHEPNTVGFADLPSGQYVLHLWQADRPEQIRGITLAAGETKTLRLH